MKLAVPDLISNSYFPAAAAVELGFFTQQGLDVSLELVFLSGGQGLSAPARRRGRFRRRLRLAAFPEWGGCKLLCAQGQGMYWFLVMRSDLKPVRDDLSIVKGRRIGAAPWVEMGLRRLLIEAGIDPQRDGVTIAPVPGAAGAGASESVVNFGLTAAKALEDGKIDGFWANGIGTEVAVRRGAGTVVLDIRRGDGPPACFNYTMASIAATDRLIRDRPDDDAGAIRAITAAHAALKSDPGLARKVGEKLFPLQKASLIESLILRDLPYYDASISPEFVDGMNAFARDLGILNGRPSYADVVAKQLSALWQD